MSGLLMSGLPITRLPDYRLTVTGYRSPVTLVFINGLYQWSGVSLGN